MAKKISKGVLYAASAIAVIVIYHICYNLSTLQPSNVSWLMTVRHDWGTHYLGWAFYRNEPWHFPIGQVSGYFYPVGTNVGFTDSIPLLAVFFKIFAPMLPGDFQYFGIWLFLCHLLTAWFTILFLRLFKVNALVTFLAVIFMTANPVLVYRGLHPALCAQWLLIASAWVYFLDPGTTKKTKILLYQFILLMLSALINPYICFMVAGFTLATVARLCFFDKVINWKYLAGYLLGSMGSIVLLWYIIGLVSFGKAENLAVEGAYGLYSLNLNALYNPNSFSSFFPPLKQVSWHQYEGFMYLGAGMFMILFVLLVYTAYGWFKKTNKNEHFRSKYTVNNISLVPLLIFVICVTLFSVTHIISLNDKVLFKIPLPSSVLRLGEVFRASARFFWIPYYLVFLFGIIAVTRMKIKPLAGVLVIVMALFLQLYDIKHLLTFRHPTYGAYESPLDNKSWISLMQQFDDVVFYPPFEASQLKQMDYQDFCYLAMKARKPINLGYVARSDYKKTQLYSDSLTAALENGKISPRSLYISTSPQFGHLLLTFQMHPNRLNTLDGYFYFFSEQVKNDSLEMLSNRLNMRNKNKLDSALRIVNQRTEFTPAARIPVSPGTPLRYFVERINNAHMLLSMSGWGFIDTTQNNKGDSIFIIISNNRKFYMANASIQARPDITAHYKRQYMDDAGFSAIVFKDSVEKGSYTVGIGIKDKLGRMVYKETGDMVTAGVPEYAVAEPIAVLPPVAKIVYGIDAYDADSSHLKIGGWAAFENQDAGGSEIALVLKAGDKTYIVSTEPARRPDVTAARPGHNLDNSGFNVNMLKNSLPRGSYQLGILITGRDGRKGVVFTGKQVDVF